MLQVMISLLLNDESNVIVYIDDIRIGIPTIENEDTLRLHFIDKCNALS